MADRTTYKASYAGVGKMLRSAEMQAGMRQLAETVKERAEQIAPVGDPVTDEHSGRYKAAFAVKSGVQRRTTSRAYGEVVNTSPEAIDVEFGNSEQDGHHVLVRALDALRE
jgi:hypothetical protein